MEGFRQCAWMGCNNEFVPRDPRQIYCCKACSDKASQFKRYRRKTQEKPAKRICDRTDCVVYQERRANHCNGLAEIPEDTKKCSFYKMKE